VNSSEITRLQGTDGVRRVVAPSSDYQGSPLQTFLKKDLMTEEFFELYTYCHIKEQIALGLMQEGDEVIIAWDPRDTKNFYTSKAVAGISKAGGQPITIGVIPTPAVPLSIVNRNAPTGFMITASHNPSDQNGIKIFLSPDGMKTLPEYDDQLSQRIFKTDYASIKSETEKYKPIDESKKAETAFIDFHSNPKNSWMEQNEEFTKELVLIIDTAHGATAGFASKLFNRLGFKNIVSVADTQNGDINENSGVALLEGLKEINLLKIAEMGRLADHQLIKKMEEYSATLSDNDQTKVYGITFDGDGDRFFLLPYNHETETIHILSGDECASFQAEYLIKMDAERYHSSLFVHSVESDINVSRHAKSIGFTPVIVPVGDKWVLQEAVASPNNFGVGCEETGHSIHGGFTLDRQGREKLFFAGNGLKGAVNTIVAIEKLSARQSKKTRWAKIASPFEAGYKRTAYSYYVDKKIFYKGSEKWKTLVAIIKRSFANNYPGEFMIEQEVMDFEPDMLFFSVKDGEGERVATIFVRNSGTEDKIGVNLRGAFAFKDRLDKIGDETVVFLLREMKKNENQYAVAEKEILEKIALNKKFSQNDFHGINFKRLITEMEVKEKIIKHDGQRFILTEMGDKLIG